MAFDIDSYEMGRKKGRKESASTVTIDGDNLTVNYDETTKTVTLTKGGENNG